MIALWCWLIFIVLLALILLIFPLCRTPKKIREMNRVVNVQIYQERIKELLQEKELGYLSADNYQKQRLELQRTLLQDSQVNQAIDNTSVTVKPWRIIILFVIAVPVFSLLAYRFWWGSSQQVAEAQKTALNDASVASYLQQYHSPDTILEQLKKVVSQHPNDPKGWFLLGRLQIGLNRNQDACASLKRSYQLKADDVDTMISYVQSCFMSNGHHITPELRQVLQQAIAQAPDNPEIINLLALNAFYAKQYQQAIDYWTSIVQRYPIDSSEAQLLQQTIEKTRQLATKKN